MIYERDRRRFERIEVKWPTTVITSDGELFLMKKSLETEHSRTELLVVENWVEELKELVPETE